MKKLILILLVALLTAAPAYAQKSFDMRYNEAVEFYTKKQYDKAIKVLDAAKKSPGVTKAQIEKANRLRNQCTSAISKGKDLNLSKEEIFAPGPGITDSIYVTAGKAWTVTACPEWCNTWQEQDVLFIEVLPNEERTSKKGNIEVTMGKERTAYIIVTQDPRLDINCPVRVLTTPGRAMVYVDLQDGALSEDFILPEGRHRIRVEKNGYERRDTTVVLGKEQEAGAVYRFNLRPLFATVSVNIAAADGNTLDFNPSLEISGNEVNLHPSTVKSFNLDQDISYYSLYEDNLIPLHPGQYLLKVSAPGYVPARTNFEAVASGNKVFDFSLDPVTGTVSVSDEENAAGALVFVDGKEAGKVPFSGLTLKMGKHSLRFEKPGFVTDQPEYEVEVSEGGNTEFKVVMAPYNDYTITSEPNYCKVYLDGEYAGTTPLNLTVREGEHLLRLEKNGYYPVEKFITPALDGEAKQLSFVMDNAYPLLVTADKDSLSVIISKGKGRDRRVYAQDVKTPATVQIPLSKEPYDLELIRSDRKTAYKGRINFSDPSKDQVKILTWEDGSPILSVNAYLLGPEPSLGSSSLNKDYRRLGEATLSSMRLFPGLSTGVAKAAFFVQTDPNVAIQYPADAAAANPVGLIPAFSILFINEEFRVGGALFPFMDVAGLATYTWYPNLSGFLNFTHMSGHDVFIGAELTSRLSIFNVNLKAGMMGFFGGEAHIHYKTAGTNNDAFVHEAYTPPMAFVISAGFTLGSNNCRGENILRVF